MKKVKRIFIATYIGYVVFQIIACAMSVFDGGSMINGVLGEDLVFPYVSLAVRYSLYAARNGVVCGIVLLVLYAIIKRLLRYTPYALDGKNVRDVL